MVINTTSKNTNYYFFNSLGRDLFLNLMYHCYLIIGNSKPTKSKIEKAKNLGVKILTETEWYKILKI